MDLRKLIKSSFDSNNRNFVKSRDVLNLNPKNRKEIEKLIPMHKSVKKTLINSYKIVKNFEFDGK